MLATASKEGTVMVAKKDPMAELELEDLRESFEKITGFVQRPTSEDPTPCKFAGVVGDTIKQAAKGKFKEGFWTVMIALYDQPGAVVVDSDGEEHNIVAGMRFGVSGSGAIKGLDKKKGHYALIEYTGRKVPTANGDMWEATCKVSKLPITRKHLPTGVEIKNMPGEEPAVPFG